MPKAEAFMPRREGPSEAREAPARRPLAGAIAPRGPAGPTSSTRRASRRRARSRGEAEEGPRQGDRTARVWRGGRRAERKMRVARQNAPPKAGHRSPKGAKPPQPVATAEGASVASGGRGEGAGAPPRAEDGAGAPGRLRGNVRERQSEGARRAPRAKAPPTSARKRQKAGPGPKAPRADGARCRGAGGRPPQQRVAQCAAQSGSRQKSPARP